ncbi:MAG: hypothetical protein JNG88_03210 [Phycisphaerales bacterium]|nr:hypothetical protein [Phycisphaerales bacterium]
MVVIGGLQASLADAVVLRGKPAFRNVTIVGLRDGGLTFRGQSGEILRIPLVEITEISLESLPEFSKGERFAATEDWPAAASAYAAETLPAEDWKRTLLIVRASRAYEHAQRFADAVRAYISLLQHTGTQGFISPPRCAGPPGSAENAEARQALAEALKADTAGASALRQLQTELSIIDDLGAPAATSQPAAEVVNSTRRSQSGRATPAPAVRLSGDSIVFDAVAAALDAGDGRNALRMLDRVRPLVPPTQDHRIRLLEARIRVSSSDPAGAAADLVALSENAPPAIASEALYYVAVAHRRMNRNDVAESTLRRLLDGVSTDAKLRTKAEKLLLEVRSTQNISRPEGEPGADSK